MALYASAASAGSTPGLPSIAMADLSIRLHRAGAIAVVEASTGSFQRLGDSGG